MAFVLTVRLRSLFCFIDRIKKYEYNNTACQEEWIGLICGSHNFIFRVVGTPGRDPVNKQVKINDKCNYNEDEGDDQ